MQGLAGSDLKTALAGGAAPYVAEIIGHYSNLDDAGKVAAHAVVNAALAAAQNKSALAGAASAATAEIVGISATQMYSKPDETQKQTVSTLATLAAGLAGGLTGGSTADTVTAAQTGKTTVENNALSLPKGLTDYGATAASWNQYAETNGLTAEQKQAGLDKLAEGANITKAIVEGYQDGVMIAGAWWWDTGIECKRWLPILRFE